MLEWIKIAIEFVKLKSLIKVKKIYFSITFNLIIIILIGNIYYGNILKIPMKLDFETKIENYLSHNRYAGQQLKKYTSQVNKIVEGEAFFISVINWDKKGQQKENYLIDAQYLQVVKWDKTLNKMVDARPYLKNDTGNHEPHDNQSSNSILESSWSGGRGEYKDYKNYLIDGGTNVMTMLGIYPFLTDKIAGATYDSGENENHRIRFVIVLSKEAADKIKNSDEIVLLVENLRDGYIKAIKGY